MIKEFDPAKFSLFTTSTKIDGNYVGLYEDKVFRIIENNKDDFSHLLNFVKSLPNLIGSKIVFRDEQKLIIEHPKLEHITYYGEWTRFQRVTAAKAVIKLQIELSKIGYYLTDPHAFNITFKYSDPIYFDLGSVKKGEIKPHWWFLKCFTGWKERDYWDDVLNIGIIKKFLIYLKMFLSKNPYEYLINKISKYESTFIERLLNRSYNRSKLKLKATLIVNNILPKKYSSRTNWTDYEQKNPATDLENIRVANFLKIINTYKPAIVLDVGANRGAYSILSLQHGVKEAICVDLDQSSLNYLFKKTNIDGLKIFTVLLNIMRYNETPGKYKTYLPAHKRLSCNFGFCFAVVHHVCYFGEYTFDEFAEKISLFVNDKLIIEFVPYNDKHLTGPNYKGKDRSWYTLDNFINAFKKYFPGKYEILESFPNPRVLIFFNK